VALLIINLSFLQRFSDCEKFIFMNKPGLQKRVTYIELGVGIILLALFMLASWLLIRRSDQEMRTEFLTKMEYVAQAINSRQIEGLTGKLDDQETGLYKRLKEQLQVAKLIFPETRFLYLLGQNPDGSIFTFIDSEAPGSSDESLPGDIYYEMTTGHSYVIDSNKSQVIGPVENIWGNWITTLVPIVDQNNGTVVAIFGADVDADQWQKTVVRAVIFPILIVFILVIFLFISLHVVLHRYHNLQNLMVGKILIHKEIIFFLILGLLITTFFSWLRFQNVSLNQQETFYQLAGARSEYIISYFNNLENIYIEGVENFIRGSQNVEREEFILYTSDLVNDTNIVDWGWVPELRKEDVSVFESEMRAMGVEDYQLWELDESGNKRGVSERPIYYPIAYMYPFENKQDVYGFDHGSEPSRLKAILEAKQSVMTTATDPVSLIRPISSDLGILIYRYVQTEEREDKQIGLIRATLNMDGLLSATLGQQSSDNPMLYMDIFQITQSDKPILLSSNSPGEHVEIHIRSFLQEHPSSTFTFTQPIFAFGKVYALVVHPGPNFIQTYPNLVGWSTTILGIVLTLMTALVVNSFVSRRFTLEKMVLERTEELQQSEQKYKNLAESTNAVLWEYNISQDRWTYVAPQVTAMTGWLPEDFTNLQFWVNHIHQEDQKWVPALIADLTQHGEDHDLEYRFIKPDGSFLWIRDVVSVEMEDGIPAIMRGYMLDVTQRKEAEEQQLLQSAALEASINAIVIADKKGKISWANQAFEKLSGYQYDEILGKEPGEWLFSGVQGPSFYANLWNTILSGVAWQGELVNKKKDGSFYNEEMSITPVKDAKGEITNFVAIKQDISDRKQYEMELEAIAKVNATVRLANSRDQLLPDILDLLMEIFNAEGSAVVIYDHNSDVFKLEAAKGVFEGNLKQNLEVGLSISGIVFESGKPFLSADVSKEEGIVWSDAYAIAKSVACVPLLVEEQMIGNLRIGRSYEINSAELRLLLSIAEIIGNAIHRETLRDEMIKQVERLSTLRSIDQVLTSSVDLKVILNFILEQIALRLKIDSVAIHLYNPVSHRLQFAEGRGFLTSEIQKTNVLIGDYNVGRVALQKKTLSKPSITSEDFPGGNLIKREHFVSYFATPVVAKGQIKGVMELFHRSHFTPDDDWINYFEILARQTAIAIDNSQLFEGLQRSNFDLSLAYDATIEGWSRAMDLRDRETEGHTLRVTDLTIQLARMAGIDEDEILHIRRGSLLHDMGKLGIPDSILHKPGPLNEEEWQLMRKHPTFAYEMIAPIDYLKKAIDIPYCHHERWDGSGYPRGLKGEEIPLIARIFAVVDVYDALTSDRPYRSAWSKEKTLDYISSLRSIQFDPQIVDLFFELIESEPGWLEHQDSER